MTVTDNTEVVLRFFENFSAGNAEAAFALLDEQAEWWITGRPDQFPLAGTYDKTRLLQMLGTVGQAMPNGVDLKVTSTTAQDDRVVVEAESRGVSATGRVYDNRIIYACQLRGDKILHVREYFDTIHAKDVLVTK
ncbi:nuclear transport factor 2 family protein [Streptomyces sp. NBC_01485]|uniref:nuclear transport factor 2 family protein n=1 Tax=Streptomyces sp. NBC_01485 TaxID=2903884 RepID=UPI002E3744BD|nr:nuclear transport factor 2 family protein [Streptomyces sp. NBC_01485]